MNVRPVVRTTFTLDEYARAVLEADPSLSRSAVAVLWAQYALETGRGSACWGHNIGNVKVTRRQVEAGVPFFMLPGTWEIIGGKRVVFEPPHEQTWFRWFASLSEAMEHHLVFLRKKYAPAWDAILAGDPTATAAALKRGRYYTGPEHVYAGSMRDFVREFFRKVTWPEPEAVEPNEVTITGPAHGTSVVDWALEQRKEERRAKLDAELCALGIVEFCGASRYDDEAA